MPLRVRCGSEHRPSQIGKSLSQLIKQSRRDILGWASRYPCPVTRTNPQCLSAYSDCRIGLGSTGGQESGIEDSAPARGRCEPPTGRQSPMKQETDRKNGRKLLQLRKTALHRGETLAAAFSSCAPVWRAIPPHQVRRRRRPKDVDGSCPREAELSAGAIGLTIARYLLGAQGVRARDSNHNHTTSNARPSLTEFKFLTDERPA